MFIDSSAVVEILILAPEREKLMRQIEDTESALITGPTVLYEASAVIASRLNKDVGEARSFVLDFLDEIGAVIVPVTRETATIALDAFARYGKGRHPARLNFGDCFSYAGARNAQVPLLYVGNDFAQTDLA
jgi:ribonuclease VapC